MVKETIQIYNEINKQCDDGKKYRERRPTINQDGRMLDDQKADKLMSMADESLLNLEELTKD
jgi:hypothetical protein